jgi:hypothetical protein
VIAEVLCFASFGGLIVGGMMLGRARDRAWQRAAQAKTSRAVRRLYPVGVGPWIVIAHGKGTVFRDASEVTSIGFSLRTESGETLAVPTGTLLLLTGFARAQRSDLPSTRVLSHWTFEVAPDQPFFLCDGAIGDGGSAPYRVGTRTLLPGDDGRLRMAGDPDGLAAGLAPRFWLLALGLLIAGAFASQFGPEAWGAVCPAVLLTILGWAAMPAPPPER